MRKIYKLKPSTMSNTNKPTIGFHTNPERINKKGAPRREWTWAGLLADALEKEFASTSGKMGQAKKLITEKIVRMAIAGDITAQKEIMNRMDGMPKQSTEIGGLDGGPLTIEIVDTTNANNE